MTTTLSVVLFNLAGTTPVKHLAQATGVKWLDELDGDGSFSFSIPVEEAGALQVGSIVRFALGETSADYVFAGIVENLKLEKAGANTGGVSRSYDVTGRGLRARLEDAVVYPVGVDTTRTFTSQSAGGILRTLVLEAQARGALTGLTINFTASLDSYGDAWDETLTIDEQVGATVGQVATNLQEIACDVWVDPTGVLNVVNERGDDLTLGANPVTLRVGGSVSELSQDLAGPIRNTVLVASGTSGATFTTRTSAGSVSTYGRRETFLSLANTADSALVTLASDQVLNNSATPADGVTVQLDPTGPQAYLDFEVGDRLWLVDNVGTKTSYRVRSLTVTQDDAGLLQFVPELGTARADLDKRLARALARIERGNAGGETDIGYAPEPEGGGAEVEVCTVVSYNSSTRSGNADCSGVSTDFDNGSIYDFYPGDEILITDTLGGDNVAVGLLQSGGGGTGSSFTFVPIGSVGGLPYDTGTGAGTIFQAGEGFISNGTGSTIIDFVTPNVFTLPTPVGFTNSLALSRLTTGTFVFQRGADADAPVTTNSLVVIHNNVASTYNYGGVRTIGVSNGVAYCYATHKGGLANPCFITVNSSGVVADFTPTVQDELGVLVPFVGPNIQPSASGSWWVAGDYGVAWSPFTGATRYVYTFAHGTTAARRWPLGAIGNFVYGTLIAQRWGRITMNDTHIYAVDTQVSGTRRSWRRMALATGVINNFTDNLPSGALADGVAAGGNAGAILISGTYDDGTGPVPAYFTTSGTGVTTTTLADTTNAPVVRRDFTGNILGTRDVTSLGRSIVIGISLT